MVGEVRRALVAAATLLLGGMQCWDTASAQSEAISCRQNTPFDVSILPQNIRNSVENARNAQRSAQEAARRARAGTEGVIYDYRPDGPQYVGYLYEGQWSNDTRNGYGRFVASPPSPYAGTSYEGLWQTGTYNGPGVGMFGNGTRYEGSWANGTMSGYGVLWDAVGNVTYAGIFQNVSDAMPYLNACPAESGGQSS